MPTITKDIITKIVTITTDDGLQFTINSQLLQANVENYLECHDGKKDDVYTTFTEQLLIMFAELLQLPQTVENPVSNKNSGHQ